MTNGIHVRLLGEPPMPPADADLAFTIDFKKGEGNPRRVFDAASELISAFEDLDEALASSVDHQIKTLMVLEDVEGGSIKIWLRNILSRIEDEAIKDLDWKKAVGTYLVKAKYMVLRFLDDDGAGGKTLEPLKNDLQKLAEATDTRHLPYYPPVHEGRLLTALDEIQDAKRELARGDKLYIETEGETYEVDLSKTWTPSDSIAVANLTETHSDGEMILTIRRPDFIKDTLWQFSHGKTNVSAPILDEQWLANFHNRKIPLLPGDALKCQVRFAYVYDEKGTLLDSKIEITKVLDVLKWSDGEQQILFPKS